MAGKHCFPTQLVDESFVAITKQQNLQIRVLDCQTASSIYQHVRTLIPFNPAGENDRGPARLLDGSWSKYRRVNARMQDRYPSRIEMVMSSTPICRAATR